MQKRNNILKVPADNELRKKLRAAAAEKMESAQLLPPASFDALQNLAMQIVADFKLSEDYLNFVIVLLGNETWRETVKATPFHRRLLLLPQCLRDKEKCHGVFDELGLNCAGCKACPVDDILLEAENLGYANLVAEGTTVAIGLVEEGSIDAVIGVSCMPVLQRSFEPVSNAAVPVIGIPLMHDGCENTSADLEWLMEEIRLFEVNKTHQPISVSELKNRVQQLFSEEEIKQFIQPESETERIASEYLLLDGQRMRPVLTALSYAAYSPEINEQLSNALAFVIECFHKASLIHDDIEDDTNLRYNYETAHVKYGIPMATNIGDYLIGLGYDILAKLNLEAKTLVKCMQVVAQSHVNITKGQGADLLFGAGQSKPKTAETLEIFQLKTGEAIKVALLLGAFAGQASESECQKLSTFSEYLGIAYQIRDDLNEFSAKEDDEKTADFPFLLALLNDSDNHFEEQKLKDVAIFRQLVLQHKIDEKADDYLQLYIGKCYAEIDQLENQQLRLSLHALLGKIFKSHKKNA